MTLSLAQHAALFAALSDGVLVMDADGRVMHADERFRALTGYGADACHGARPPFEWWPDEPVGVLHDGVEVLIHRRDGARVPVRVTDRIVGGTGPGAGGWVRVLRAGADDTGAAARWRRAAAEAVALRHVAEAGGRDDDPVAVLGVAAQELAALLDARSVVVYRDEAGSARMLVAHGDDAAHEVGGGGRPAPGSALAAMLQGEPWVATVHEAGIEVPAGGGTRGMIVVHGPACGPAGARDLLERFHEALAPAVAAAEARACLARQATTDSLTGLANHRTFHERLGDEVARARRHGRPLSLCVLDIDDFKGLNDLCGHQAGDRALVSVAAHLRQVARAGDLVARVGGDEFAWVLPESDGARALAAAGRVRALVAAAGGALFTISAGVCDLADARDAPHLFRLADGALYRAKSHGRDQSRLHDPDAGDVVSAAGRARGSHRGRAVIALRALADMVDAMHAGYDHSARVAALAARLAVATGWTAGEVADLREAARLHDIGKVGMPGGAPPTTIEEAIAGGFTALRSARLGSRLAADALTPEQCTWIHNQCEPYDARVQPHGVPPRGEHVIAVAEAWDMGVRVVGPAEPGPTALFGALNEQTGTRFCPRVVEALGRLGVADGARAAGAGAVGGR